MTLLYYTANRERYDFEKRVRENILKNTNLPIVSVSQFPIDFGHNVCVGEHDCCYYNEFRQIQIGLRLIKTPYVLTAESDCFYPPHYFTFRPTRKRAVYRYTGVWVCYTNNFSQVYYKGHSDGSQLVDRAMWLEDLNDMLGKEERWQKKEDPFVYTKFRRTNLEHTWTSEEAVLTFKTPAAVRSITRVKAGIVKDQLYPWGTMEDIKRLYES